MSADLLRFCTGAYLSLSKLSVSPKLRRVCIFLSVMLLHRHRAIIWFAFGVVWIIPGGGVGVKFDVFSNCYAVCWCCLHASNDPLC